MTRVVASPHAERPFAAIRAGELGIGLYRAGSPALPGVGHQLLNGIRKLPRPPSIAAWDFLSIALAVFGADRFLLRDNTEDGWTRQIYLEVDLVNPAPWEEEADQLSTALRFLTGDIWQVGFRPGGLRPPRFQVSLSDRDCVCLFSGGLDSLIGAMDLVVAGRRPILVSQASIKEAGVQSELARRIGMTQHRFDGHVIERYMPPYEPSSRARSILFIAYGAIAASALATDRGQHVQVNVPENGLISINPPLTLRRIGSLSTRTTHPYFISCLQEILGRVGLHVTIVNPYCFKTKGEMLLECRDQNIRRCAATSYSCGKGKRLNAQCGRCVPCLIRRAAFHHAGLRDRTPYAVLDLAEAAENEDVFAARFAVANLGRRDIAQWAAEAGPLPHDAAQRAMYVDVVNRGLTELKDFLDDTEWP